MPIRLTESSLNDYEDLPMHANFIRRHSSLGRFLLLSCALAAALFSLTPTTGAGELEKSGCIELPHDDAYLWFRDATSGLLVAQLTRTVGDNYAFYHHQPANDPSGRYLVYRNLACAGASSLTYYRLDIESGEKLALTPIGLANGGYVHGEHLYAFGRDSVNGPLDRIDRWHLETGASELVVEVPGTLRGSMSINSEGAIAYIYEDPNEPDKDHNLVMMLHRPGDPSNGSLDVELVRGGTNEDAGIRHIQFSPTDPNLLTFRYIGYGLDAHAVCRVDLPACQPLSSSDPFFGLYGNFAHAFWGAEGHLWVDAIWSAVPQNPEQIVRFSLDTEPPGLGAVDSFDLAPIDTDEWQLHMSTTPSAGFFIGDGAGSSHTGHGLPFIHLVEVDMTSQPGIFTQEPLSSSLSAETLASDQANAKLLRSGDGVTFTAPWDLTDCCPTCNCTGAWRNVFLVVLGNVHKAKLAAALTTTIPGPYKHGNRVVVRDGIWYVDHGQPQSFGDGITDQKITHEATSFAISHVALADVNGDGVDDRIALGQKNGQWNADVRFTPFGGLLEEGAAGQQRSWEGAFVRPPAFGDIDGDGRADLVTVTDIGGVLRWTAHRNVDGTLPPLGGMPGYINAPFGSVAVDQHIYLDDVNRDGYADRLLARVSAGGWKWHVDYTGPAGFIGGADDIYTGGNAATDQPLVGDADGDGYADLLLARDAGLAFRWYVNFSTASGFGGGWSQAWSDPARNFGDPEGQPLIGTLARYATRADD